MSIRADVWTWHHWDVCTYAHASPQHTQTKTPALVYSICVYRNIISQKAEKQTRNTKATTNKQTNKQTNKLSQRSTLTI